MVDVGWLMVDWMLVGCRLMGWLVVASIVAAIRAHLAQGDEGNR